ncbi:MAG: SPOR domain-containing protein [Thermomonas sp.]
MDSSLKQRLVGASVLVALAVIFLPMLVKGPAPDSGVSDVSLDIPAEPKGDSATRTVDLPLMPAASAPQGGVVGMPADARDDGVVSPGSTPFATLAAGDYVVSFGSYATAADAGQVIAALRDAGLPAFSEPTKVNGRDAQRVRIGPFADRAMAESARLAAGKVNSGVDAKVLALDATPAAPAPAKVEAAPVPSKAVPVPSKPEPLPPVTKPVAPPAIAAAKPVAATTPPPTPTVAPATVAKPAADTGKTGFVVQVGAFTSATDANALRDKLRAAGFNTFTDTVTTDKGVLTRVRVGPAMNRAEADALNASVKAKVGLSGMVRPHP